MARGGAPSQRPKGESGKDATVVVPAAVWPAIKRGGVLPAGELTPEDIIQMQSAQIRELEAKLNMQEMAAHTIAVTACCLIKAIKDRTGVGVSAEGAIEIPRELYERTRGAEIQIANHEKGRLEPVYCRIVEGGK